MKAIRKLLQNRGNLLAVLFLVLVMALLLSRVIGPGEPADRSGKPEVQIEASEAADHIGRVGEVCGTVAQSRYMANVRGKPTFLNLDRPYPDQIFTAVIWSSERHRWPSSPEEIYREGNRICVTGRIEEYDGRPQIIVSSPDQIEIRH